MAEARGPLLSRQNDVLQILVLEREREGVCTMGNLAAYLHGLLQALAKVTTATTLVRINYVRGLIETRSDPRLFAVLASRLAES